MRRVTPRPEPDDQSVWREDSLVDSTRIATTTALWNPISTPPEPKREAFVFQADTFIGKTIAEYLKEKFFNVTGTLSGQPSGKKKPSYLARAFHLPLSPTVKPNHVDHARAVSRRGHPNKDVGKT
eukprot:1148300-Pyramimonas_sp.AAC.2